MYITISKLFFLILRVECIGQQDSLSGKGDLHASLVTRDQALNPHKGRRKRSDSTDFFSDFYTCAWAHIYYTYTSHTHITHSSDLNTYEAEIGGFCEF